MRKALGRGLDALLPQDKTPGEKGENQELRDGGPGTPPYGLRSRCGDS